MKPELIENVTEVNVEIIIQFILFKLFVFNEDKSELFLKFLRE